MSASKSTYVRQRAELSNPPYRRCPGEFRTTESMLNILPGSYVTHAKLAELGSGEIMGAQDGRLSIRFASGSRDFMEAKVMQHLTVTNEAPAAPPPRKSATRARKAAVAKAAPAARPAK